MASSPSVTWKTYSCGAASLSVVCFYFLSLRDKLARLLSMQIERSASEEEEI